MADYIEKSANICYHCHMNNFFEYKLEYNQISFYLGNNPTLIEREIHSYHELILYMENVGDFLTESGQRILKNNTLILIPKETYHFFKLPQEQSFNRLKISIPHSVICNTPFVSLMSEIKVIEDPGNSIMLLLKKLMSVLKRNRDEADSFFAKVLLMHLLCELNTLSEAYHKEIAKKSPFFTDITAYISNNLSDNLDIQTLSRIMHTSPSQLTHAFKREFGISLHKYITEKRLSLARHLLNEGKSPTKIYTDTGFKDYSSFYKAYMRFYGYPPSKENEI